MTLIEEKYDSEGRFHEYVFSNDNLIPIKPALRLIYSRLTHLPSFIESGNKKIIMVHGIIDNKDFSLHHNILIENGTLFEDYYSEIEDIIQVRYDEFYDIDAIQLFRIRIWNMDNIENQHIKITQVARKPYPYRNYQMIQKRNYQPIKIQKRSIHHITPLKYSSKHIEGFLAMDIETISNDTKSQIPILISLYGCNISKYFIINDHLDTNKLFIKLFKYLSESFKLNKKIIIFIHNLGGFDGIFIYKYLVNNMDSSQINCIIDDDNKFILISVKINDLEIIFKDSYRIFPVSLNDLCKVFNVPGKLSSYNSEFNNIDLLKDKNSNLFIDFIH